MKDVVEGVGYADRILVLDISPGVDLITGLIQACKANKITCGLICSCIGSLQEAHFESIAYDPNSPTGGGFGTPQCVKGPIQVINGQGCIGEREDGELFVHLHITFVSGRDGTIFGGHIEQGHNLALNRLEVGLITAKQLSISTELDPRTGQLHLVPRSQ
jgi:predicted DNA-binding protein with PD1-like motif